MKSFAAGVVALALIAGAGAAIAAADGGLGTDQQTFLNDVAKRLGVTPEKLQAALKGAYADRLDAAVAAGKLTQEQADELQQRADDHGGLPPFGGPRIGGPGGRGDHGPAGGVRIGIGLDAASAYLGLTEAALRTQLEGGKSLADVAKAQGKTVDGLEKALVAAAKTRLDAAVKDGKLTSTQAAAALERMQDGIGDLVAGARLGGGPGKGGHRFGPGRGDGAPSPPAASQRSTPRGSPAPVI